MSSTKFLQRVDIFISSPSDVSLEREIFFRVIEKLNRLPHIRAKYILMPLGYEREVPPTSGDVAQSIVNRYMTEAKDCYLCVCILWSRMGTPFIEPRTQKSFQSGTEYEFMSAYEAHEKHGEPHILLYRKIADNPTGEPEEKAKVEAFFKRFEGETSEFKGLYKTYTNLEAFETALFEHILQILHEHPPQSQDSETLAVQSPSEIVEESRRLDAAMPRQIFLREPTELWVQICLPDSDGFRSELPYITKQGNVIDQKGVHKGNLAVVFPVIAGTPQPIQARIEVKAPDFTIVETYRDIRLSPKRDGAKLVFALTPNQVRQRSIIHVLVTTKALNGVDIVLGSVSLDTTIEPVGVQLAAKVVWSILSAPLGVLVTNALSHSTDTRSNDIKDTNRDNQQPVQVAPAPAPTTDDLMNIDPMKWLESLAARQGADPEELTTSADFDIPLPENVVINEPGYVDYDPFTGSGKPAQPTQQSAQAAPEPAVSDSLEDSLSGIDPLMWLDDLETPSDDAALLENLPLAQPGSNPNFEQREQPESTIIDISAQDFLETGGLPNDINEVQAWLEARATNLEKTRQELESYDVIDPDAPAEPAAELPDWLRDIGHAPPPAPVISDNIAIPSEPTELPDWLHSPDKHPISGELGSTLPEEIDEWTEALEREYESIAVNDAAVPAWYLEAIERAESENFYFPVSPLPEVEAQLVASTTDDSLPDWLVGSNIDEKQAALPADIPDWLREMAVTEPESDQLTEQVIDNWLIEAAPVPPVPQPIQSAPARSAPAPQPVPTPTAQASSDYQSRLQQARQLVTSNLSAGLAHYQALIDAAQLLEEIRDDLQQLIEQYPKQPRLRCLLGDVYARLGDLQSALDTYHSALNQF